MNTKKGPAADDEDEEEVEAYEGEDYEDDDFDEDEEERFKVRTSLLSIPFRKRQLTLRNS